MSDSNANDAPVMIVGAGLSGLACARTLHAADVPFLILEASDRVGGRVATDVVNGFRLDRGFQVLLTAYPEATRVLAYSQLRLREFYPGALVQIGDRRYRFADPRQKPLAAAKSLRAPIASMKDALHIAALRRVVSRDCDPTKADGTTTRQYLEQQGLSQRVIDRFFRPFFGGVFLERELATPAAFFRFVFSMFAKGPAAVPETGMQAIPEQLAANLRDDTVRLETRVQRVEPGAVHLAGGEKLSARAVVIATDAATANALSDATEPIEWNSATTVYYTAPRSPLSENILVLNGNGTGVVNNVCVPSDVSASYAPKGRSLISVSVFDVPDDDAQASNIVLDELRAWFGPSVDQWQLLRIYRIPQALPRYAVPRDGRTPQPRDAAADTGGIIICGDHTHDPSINGALISGRKAAETILARQRN